MMQMYQFPVGFNDELYLAINQGKRTITTRSERLVKDLELGDLEFELCAEHGILNSKGDLQQRAQNALADAEKYDIDSARIQRAAYIGLQQNVARLLVHMPVYLLEWD
ncbi:hypothetical protein HZA96_01860 [Candidatus Woesearchaeota archaeon]|nr:hypothetical protein [Candidatus Woesearchaeota archaeon]